MSTRTLTFQLLLMTPAVSFGEASVTGRFQIEFSDRYNAECSFAASPVDYCSDEFLLAYENALSKPVNFNRTLIITPIDTRPEYAQQALVAIDPITKMVYPLPFDHFTKAFDENAPNEHGRLVYSVNESKICVHGEVMSYRSVQQGPMCWTFIDDKFVGDITPYTYPDH